MYLHAIFKSCVFHVLRYSIPVFCGCILSVYSGRSEAQDVNSYTINRAMGKITIDGKLDEKAWDKAAEVSLTETNTGNAVPLKSTVKCLWDDSYLYVGFYCEDPDAWATISDEDGPLWGEEVVELFIDPDGNGTNYYEHEINPINVKVDLFVINAGKARKGRIEGWFDWDFKGLKSAVYVDGDGKKEGTNDKYWVVEVAVPFDDLWETPNNPPKDGDMWRMNLYRIERGKSSTKDDDWYAAFNPTKRPSFHTPWEFGKFYFKK